jgi:hypothetical protein
MTAKTPVHRRQLQFRAVTIVVNFVARRSIAFVIDVVVRRAITIMVEVVAHSAITIDVKSDMGRGWH